MMKKCSGRLPNSPFGPTHPSVAAATAALFPRPSQLFTISELGGWDKVFSSLFSPEGSW